VDIRISFTEYSERFDDDRSFPHHSYTQMPITSKIASCENFKPCFFSFISNGSDI